MKLKGKQVALYMDNETHTKAKTEAKKLNISFSKYVALLVNMKGVEFKLQKK